MPPTVIAEARRAERDAHDQELGHLRDADRDAHGRERAVAAGGREVAGHQRGDDQEAGLQQLADAHPEDGLQHGGREREPARRQAHVLAAAVQPGTSGCCRRRPHPLWT
jgi:hypothetical protein